MSDTLPYSGLLNSLFRQMHYWWILGIGPNDNRKIINEENIFNSFNFLSKFVKAATK